jgi:hypothetical protein
MDLEQLLCSCTAMAIPLAGVVLEVRSHLLKTEFSNIKSQLYNLLVSFISQYIANHEKNK